MRNILVIVLMVVSILISGCYNSNEYHKFRGETMGTYYNIIYELPKTIDRTELKQEVDLLLTEINDEVSTYISSSLISQVNNSAKDIVFEKHNGHFKTNLEISTDLYEITDGYFDPTVMPLVNFWGFGYTAKVAVSEIDSSVIDSIMAYVGYEKIGYRSENNTLFIDAYKGELDFSAIAKGYAVDRIGELLRHKGALNFFVEIGGEVLVKGFNDKGQKWVIGINEPSPDAKLNDLIEYLSISNKALASSISNN